MGPGFFDLLYKRVRERIRLLKKRMKGAGNHASIDRVAVPVLVSKDGHKLRGNAFLVDPESGIFVTCAHVLDLDPESHAIRAHACFGGVWSQIETRRSWVFEADDVAFFRLERKARYPDVTLASRFPEVGFPLHLMGFKGLFWKSVDLPILYEVPLFTSRASWGMCVVEDGKRYPPPQFTCYVTRNSDMQNFQGFSGSPIFSRDGVVFGMMQAGLGNGNLIMMSALRIKMLLRKMQKSLGATTS